MGEREGSERRVEGRINLSERADIGLNIETYNDIFSSFDPRPYSQKALSQDLLNELKRATRETTPGGIELTFIMPRDKRNWEHEVVIKRRLREHFKKHYIQLVSDSKRLKFRGYGMALLGVLMIFVSSLLYSIEDSNFLIRFLVILLEPAGWFTAWTGLEDIYYTGRELKKELDFYEKMSNAEVAFVST
ncbi:MAG: hypothetical protein AABX66_02550 [Nanoarchaeota archaeon]